MLLGSCVFKMQLLLRFEVYEVSNRLRVVPLPSNVGFHGQIVWDA